MNEWMGIYLNIYIHKYRYLYNVCSYFVLFRGLNLCLLLLVSEMIVIIVTVCLFKFVVQNFSNAIQMKMCSNKINH